ncbi:TPA: hypothetical protein U2C46_000934 [Streptococcus suis]|nr:hypothetical protein [Streptococcus suis]
MILVFYFLLQVMNILFICLIISYQIWNYLLIIPLYLILRFINYEICRLLGYYALDEMGRFGYGTKEVLYPRFRKIEQVYRKKYNQRSRKHQLIYYAGFVMIYSVSFPFLIIVAMFVTEAVKSMIGENLGEVIIGVFIMSILLLFTLVHGKLQSYKRNYAKWFNLEIIMWEHGHPVFREKKRE